MTFKKRTFASRIFAKAILAKIIVSKIDLMRIIFADPFFTIAIFESNLEGINRNNTKAIKFFSENRYF